MKSTQVRKEQRAPRRWRTPPPLTRGSETLEGMDILREVGGEAGILLWQAYRNVMFWATAEPAERGKLFSAEAGQKRMTELLDAAIPTDLLEPLVAVGRMLSTPESTTDEAVAEACGAVAKWAERNGYEATSLSFTQAAALATPRSATLSLAVGQIARRRGELARAETWFRHAIMVARQTGDWASYSRAYLSLGNMLMRRGNLPSAYRMHIKALRAARRKGIVKIQGEALHDMFVISHEMGRFEQAEDYVRMAYRAYGPDHPRLPALAHDIAYIWMERGFFARALPIFQALEARFSTPVDRIALVSSIARAAGGAGQREVFRKAWIEVMRMAREQSAEAVLPAAVLELAEGAASLGEWDRAEQAAEQAFKAATERGQGKVQHRAEALLQAIRNDRIVEKRVAHEAAATTAKADTLANELVRSLEASEDLVRA